MSDTLTFRKAETGRWQHAGGDKRPPTAYAVYTNDGLLLGTVRSVSRESWRHLPSGVRYGFRGYSRSWEAIDPEGNGRGSYHRERRDAVRALLRERTP